MSFGSKGAPRRTEAGSAFFITGERMENVWVVITFVIGYSSMATLSACSMISIDRNLRARQARMKEK